MHEFKKFETSYDLSEAFALNPTVNKETGIIHNVAILTGNKITRNKTFYTDSALNEAASRYEGAKMYLDHPREGEKNRSIRDFGGIYRNVRREGNLLKGDLQVIESLRPHIFSIAEMRPKGVGLSIRDRGRGREEGGVFLVEGFKEGAQFSIDFVTEVSSNQDLYESDDQGGNEKMDFTKLTKEDIEKNRMDLAESFRTEGKASMAKDLEEAKQMGDAAKVLAAKILAVSEANIEDEKIRKSS